VSDPVSEQLGMSVGAIAVMGKWELHVQSELCLQEVSARCAAALAIAEAVEQADVYLISAEGHLRGQPRPGCQMAGERLIELGADSQRVRCWPAANRSLDELRALDQMRKALLPTGGGLLLVTSGYHLPRVRYILQHVCSEIHQVQAISCTGSLVQQALFQLSHDRRQRLAEVIERGRTRGVAKIMAALSEGISFGGSVFPRIEGRVANILRGRVNPEGRQMFEPGSD
jgi:hypothetical protein